MRPEIYLPLAAIKRRNDVTHGTLDEPGAEAWTAVAATAEVVVGDCAQNKGRHRAAGSLDSLHAVRIALRKGERAKPQCGANWAGNWASSGGGGKASLMDTNRHGERNQAEEELGSKVIFR